MTFYTYLGITIVKGGGCNRLKEEMYIPNMVQESVNGNAGASDLQQATPVAKQTMCEHMVDAASCKGEDAGDASSRFLNHVRYMPRRRPEFKSGKAGAKSSSTING